MSFSPLTPDQDVVNGALNKSSVANLIINMERTKNALKGNANNSTKIAYLFTFEKQQERETDRENLDNNFSKVKTESNHGFDII